MWCYKDEEEKRTDDSLANFSVQTQKSTEVITDLVVEKGTPKPKRASFCSIMKDVFISTVVFVLVTLIAQDLDPNRNPGRSIFVWPLSGVSKESSNTVTPAAATTSGDGGTGIRRYKTGHRPFFNEENSYVDDYYEGHIYSAFQVRQCYVQISWPISSPKGICQVYAYYE